MNSCSGRRTLWRWSIGGAGSALELTPVAIQAGERLARRLFADGDARRLPSSMDYSLVPTTVFTPVEYGCVGLSEADAIAKYGANEIDAFLWQWSSLEREALPTPTTVEQGERPPNCMAKLVCLRDGGNNPSAGRIVGFHFVGPNAGEVTQGFALAMRCGATKAALDDVVGIHPTDAEALTDMRVERRQISSQDDWTASGGCGGGKCG